MSSVYSEKNEKPEFWFNLKTLKVEVGRKSAAAYRVGPFDSADEARAALATINKRSAAWDADDEKD